MSLSLSVAARRRVMPGPSACCVPDPLSIGTARHADATLRNGVAPQAREVNPLARIADVTLHRANRCFVHTETFIPRWAVWAFITRCRCAELGGCVRR